MDVLDGVLEASPEAVLVVDREGVIRRANRNTESVLGYSPSELEGMVVEDLLQQADRDRHVQLREEYMAAPEPRPLGRDVDLYARTKDGTNVPVEIGLGPFEWDDNVYIVATIVDITERKQREDELQRQNERLAEFTSIVSHDLRNPLNVAAGQLALAMEECDNNHLDAVARAHDRMSTLIDDLLTLAREGEAVTAVEPVELASLVEGCWRNVGTKDASLVVDTDRTIHADKGRLKQFFENLLRNAVEHGGDDVTVTIGGLQGGFYVEDDGAGIPKEQRDSVFQYGYSTSEGGTGFGLAIVNRIVDAHGWEIRITEGEQGGTRFDVTGVAMA